MGRETADANVLRKWLGTFYNRKEKAMWLECLSPGKRFLRVKRLESV